jgi:hypothetical protein
MLESKEHASNNSGGMFMSEKYLIVSQPEQVPPYDPKAMAEGLGMSLVGFLGPLLLELDQWLDKRLIRTLVQVIEAILTFRDRINGLVLSELGSYLDPIGQGGGTKRLSRLLHSPKWTALFIERFLWWRASEQIEQWEEQGEEGLVLWDGSVWEKPESLKSEGLGPVQSSKAKRLTHVKPGYYTPPGQPISVPGLHWVGLLLIGCRLNQGPALLAVMRWWTARGWRASWVRDEDKKLLEMAIRSWGRKVLHIFDRGYASSLWLGALSHFAARFVLRWRHQYRLLFEGKLKAAWKIAQGKKAWGSRGLWDARRRKWISASVLAFPVRHPDHPDLPLWLVVARRTGGKPWYLLTSEPVENEAQAWKVVLAYARRWQIELAWKTCKSELGMQSPRVWDWESRLKLLGLATLAYAFLLYLLTEPFTLLRRWLFRYACHRTGRHLQATHVPLARLRLAVSRLWLVHPPRFSRRAALAC